jgi:hypothetical protein
LFGLIAKDAWNVGFAEGSERAQQRRKKNAVLSKQQPLLLFRSESFSAPFSVAFDLGLLMVN